MKSSHNISFVIVTYNSKETIDECIGSILAQEPKPLEVLVVDNASEDGTPDHVYSTFPGAILIRNEHNVGFGAANNAAAQVARGDFIAMVNPDAALDSEWSSEITKAIEADERCAAAEGKLLLADRPGIVNCAGSSINILGFGCMNHYGEARTAAQEEATVGYASGAAFAIRRDAFLGVGGFDESYFLYHDDVELGLRVYEAGWRIRYAPKAIAYHHYKSKLSPAKVRYLERNRWKTLAKHMPMSYFIRCGPLLAVTELALTLRLAMEGLLGPKASAIFDFLHDLSGTLEARRQTRSGCRDSKISLRLLTADWPAMVPDSGRLEHAGRDLVEAYHRVFIKGGQGTLVWQ